MRSNLNRKRRGFLLIDALAGMFVLCIGALALFAAMPVAHKAANLAADQGKATYIATKYIEQMQTLKTSDLTLTKLTTLNVVDAGQTGAPPYNFTHVPLDEGSYYSPATMLKGATATVNFTNLDSGSVRVEVTIRWKSATGHQEQLVSGSIIGGYK